METKKGMENFIKKIPKAELHVHIEGTFEPELIFKIAKRNSIHLKEKSAKELRLAYKFKNLQQFLDISQHPLFPYLLQSNKYQ